MIYLLRSFWSSVFIRCLCSVLENRSITIDGWGLGQNVLTLEDQQNISDTIKYDNNNNNIIYGNINYLLRPISLSPTVLELFNIFFPGLSVSHLSFVWLSFPFLEPKDLDCCRIFPHIDC